MYRQKKGAQRRIITRRHHFLFFTELAAILSLREWTIDVDFSPNGRFRLIWMCLPDCMISCQTGKNKDEAPFNRTFSPRLLEKELILLLLSEGDESSLRARNSRSRSVFYCVSSVLPIN